MAPPAAKPRIKTLDTRRSPRRIFTRPIGVLALGKYSVEQALQLSEGGIVFQALAPLPVKCQVVTTLNLPGGTAVVARGEVTGVKTLDNEARQIAVKFAPLPLQQRRLIRNYVAAKTQEEAELEIDQDEISKL